MWFGWGDIYAQRVRFLSLRDDTNALDFSWQPSYHVCVSLSQGIATVFPSSISRHRWRLRQCMGRCRSIISEDDRHLHPPSPCRDIEPGKTTAPTSDTAWFGIYALYLHPLILHSCRRQGWCFRRARCKGTGIYDRGHGEFFESWFLGFLQQQILLV